MQGNAAALNQQHAFQMDMSWMQWFDLQTQKMLEAIDAFGNDLLGGISSMMKGFMGSSDLGTGLSGGNSGNSGIALSSASSVQSGLVLGGKAESIMPQLSGLSLNIGNMVDWDGPVTSGLHTIASLPSAGYALAA